MIQQTTVRKVKRIKHTVINRMYEMNHFNIMSALFLQDTQWWQEVLTPYNSVSCSWMMHDEGFVFPSVFQLSWYDWERFLIQISPSCLDMICQTSLFHMSESLSQWGSPETCELNPPDSFWKSLSTCPSARHWKLLLLLHFLCLLSFV